MKALGKRVAADQILMYTHSLSSQWTGLIPDSRAPVGLALFLGSMGVMEGRKRDQIADKFHDLYWPALVTNWQVWPLAQVRAQLASPYQRSNHT